MSKANKLASLAVDVNNLSELADQVTDIENAIVRANTNAQLIDGIADDIEALEANTAVIMNDFADISNVFNSGITYSTDGVNEYYDANSVTNTVATVDIIEMNIQNPQDGELLSYSSEVNTWVNSPAPVIPEMPSPVLSFRNKLINGNFDIWQRGTSLSNQGFCADRWFVVPFNSTTATSQQLFTNGQTEVPGNPKFYHRTVVTSVAGSGNYVRVQQRIEGVETLAGKTVTLSFWAKADSNKDIATEFFQYMGTGGSPSTGVNQIGVTTHSLTTSWQKFTTTVSIPEISGKTIGTDGNDFITIHFWLEAGSDYNSRTNSLGQQSGTFDIAQVQLEEGEVATPFEHRPYGLELRLCQRYFERGKNSYSSTGYHTSFIRCGQPFLVEKRVTPTVIFIGTKNSGGADVTISNTSSSTHLGWQANSVGTSYGLVFAYEADAEL